MNGEQSVPIHSNTTVPTGSVPPARDNSSALILMQMRGRLPSITKIDERPSFMSAPPYKLNIGCLVPNSPSSSSPHSVSSSPHSISSTMASPLSGYASPLDTLTSPRFGQDSELSRSADLPSSPGEFPGALHPSDKEECKLKRCLLCERGQPDLLTKSPTWASIMRVVFFCLAFSTSEKQFFNLKTDVYAFMNCHWDLLCLSKKKTDNWHKQIQDMLSHSKSMFESGVDRYKQNGYWRLRSPIDPWTLQRPATPSAGAKRPAEFGSSELHSQALSSSSGFDRDLEYEPNEDAAERGNKRMRVEPTSTSSSQSSNFVEISQEQRALEEEISRMRYQISLAVESCNRIRSEVAISNQNVTARYESTQQLLDELATLQVIAERELEQRRVKLQMPPPNMAHSTQKIQPPSPMSQKYPFPPLSLSTGSIPAVVQRQISEESKQQQQQQHPLSHSADRWRPRLMVQVDKASSLPSRHMSPLAYSSFSPNSLQQYQQRHMDSISPGRFAMPSPHPSPNSPHVPHSPLLPLTPGDASPREPPEGPASFRTHTHSSSHYHHHSHNHHPTQAQQSIPFLQLGSSTTLPPLHTIQSSHELPHHSHHGNLGAGGYSPTSMPRGPASDSPYSASPIQRTSASQDANAPLFQQQLPSPHAITNSLTSPSYSATPSSPHVLSPPHALSPPHNHLSSSTKSNSLRDLSSNFDGLALRPLHLPHDDDDDR